jgi:hypothetical protein
MSKYSTTAGIPTRGDAYSKLIHHLDEARNQACVLAHLHRTEDSNNDRIRAQGWLAIDELISRMRAQIVKLAQGKLQ